MPKPRSPNAIKVLRGTDKPSRIRDEADFPPVTSTDPPDWLISPVAVEEWEDRIAQLTAANLVTRADLTALAHYCNMHAAAVKLWRAGMSPTAADMTQLRMMFNEFGFTPTSRSKPSKVADGGSKSPFENLTGKKQA